MDFQDAMFDYMADFIFNEILPETYDYTKPFGLWKGKSTKLNLNMMGWNGKLLKRKNEAIHNS